MKKHKFNIVDIIAVVLIVLVLGFVGSKYLNRSSGSAETNTVTVRYTVLCEGWMPPSMRPPRPTCPPS